MLSMERALGASTVKVLQRLRRGSFHDTDTTKYTPEDFRFTVKGDDLYAIGLGWPTDRKILIKSLAEDAANYPGNIRKVEMLGAKTELKWTRGRQGLEIQVPDVPPCKYAFAFHILAS